MSKPITPDEIGSQLVKSIPPEIFEIFNNAIAVNWSGNSSRFTQSSVVADISIRMGCDTQNVYDNGWLNVEEAYRGVGWKVVYDRPGYNESYGAFWIFSKK